MVLKYTETGNVLETIRRFQRQFTNQRTPCRQTVMDNYNKFVQYGLNLNSNVGSGRSCSETAFETWLFTEHYRFTLYFKLKPFSHPFTYWKRWSGMWCALAIFVQFFCSLLHSSVPVLCFTYRKTLEHYRIIDYITRVIIPLFKWLNVENRFSRFQQKVAQSISRLRFQLCITFVLDYQFTWKKRLTKL